MQKIQKTTLWNEHREVILKHMQEKYAAYSLGKARLFRGSMQEKYLYFKAEMLHFSLGISKPDEHTLFQALWSFFCAPEGLYLSTRN